MAQRDMRLVVQLSQDTKKISQDVGGLRQQLSGYAKTIGRLGAGLGLALGAREAVQLVGDAISKASELEEAQSKLGVVFQDNADQVRLWAATLDTAYGVSERQAATYAGTLGQISQAMGLTRAESAAFSTDLVELAGDMASFSNVGIERALEALRSGISGEFEPLKSLGVLINETVLKEAALEAGIVDTSRKLNQREKILAIQAALWDQTADAQGDAARTADTYAGQLRQLNATVDNLMTDLGGRLLPLVAEGLTLIVQSAAAAEAILASMGLIQAPFELYATETARMESEILALGGDIERLGQILVESGGDYRLAILAGQEYVDGLKAQGAAAEAAATSIGDRFGVALSTSMKGLRKYARRMGLDIGGTFSEALGQADVELFSFDFGSPQGWVDTINKDLKQANTELKELLNNPKAKASLEAGITTMGERTRRLINKTTRAMNLDSAGGALMALYGQSILGKVGKAQGDVNAALEELGAKGHEKFKAQVKWTPAEFVAAMPSEASVGATWRRLGTAARAGFIDGFGTVAADQGAAGGGARSAPQASRYGATGGTTVNVTTIGDPTSIESAVVSALRRTGQANGAVTLSRLRPVGVG